MPGDQWAPHVGTLAVSVGQSLQQAVEMPHFGAVELPVLPPSPPSAALQALVSMFSPLLQGLNEPWSFLSESWSDPQ